MSFTDTLDKFRIKLFAPTILCYRTLGHFQSEFKYWAWLPAFIAFSGQPIDKDGYYKTIYVNNKRIKWYNIIPRNAVVEIRERPKGIETVFMAILTAITLNTSITGIGAVVLAGVATFAAYAAAAVGIASLAGALTAKKSANSSGTPTYSSSDNPQLSGSKNEILENCVPICFGRIKQTFSYGQYTLPLVKSGYGGNRYRVYSIASYENARYSEFSIGDVLLSNYRSAAYEYNNWHGTSTFHGWDNACTESFSDKELDFDTSQNTFASAIIDYNETVTGTSLKIKQTYRFENTDTSKNWANKEIEVVATYVDSYGETTTSTKTFIIHKADLTSSYTSFTKTITMPLDDDTITEYLRTTTSPNGDTRGKKEKNTKIYLVSETVTIGDTSYTKTVEDEINSSLGDRTEVISQSQTDTKYCDIHFSFPQGLYKVNTSGGRTRVTIKAEIMWKKISDTVWRDLSDSGVSKIYTRNIDSEIESLSSRITQNGNEFTFKTPQNINDANNKFFECVGIQFATSGQYLVRIRPIEFTRTNTWVGSICISEVVWRLADNISVVSSDMLPHVHQIACTFNATTQLDGEVDELNAICEPVIKNLDSDTEAVAKSRNPVDIIYYLLTDTHSNPRPMTESQLDMDSFRKARKWCEEHNCKCDGIISEDTKYETIINDICDNNQLYLIPNKWGKVVLRVDTNEDGRPVKTLFNAENSWDLEITRVRGKLGRTMALRFSFTNEDTWSDDEITGYWYNGQCNWKPEDGKDDTYYQTEKRDINYIVNADNIKRRIAYELELANVKNVKATFKVAREVLDLEILDRVYVADYTRIKDGLSGTITGIIEENGQIVGVKTNAPFVVNEGMTMTIRSVDTTGNNANITTLALVANDSYTSSIYFETPIASSENNFRTAGFYTVDDKEFYYSGDLFTAGTAELLSMVVSEIEEVSGDDFTSKITCRLY